MVCALMTSDTRHLTIRIPALLFDELRRRATLEDRSVSSVTRRCISSALAVDQLGPDQRIRPTGDATPFESARP